MEWVEPFYSQGGRWWGAAEWGIESEHGARADAVERLVGDAPKVVLELGAGYGATAAVLADRGHTVTAVELSPVRAGYARRHAADRPRMTAVEGDFYDLDLGGGYDLVVYWNGFGVGTDADQRRLLGRIAGEWLGPGGVALVTVFSPSYWIRLAGQEWDKRARPAEGYPADLTEAADFDPVGGRFVDRWWPTGAPERVVAQDLRCYSPADMLLLLEGTGLALARAEVGGQVLDLVQQHTAASPLWDAYEYLTVLTPAR